MSICFIESREIFYLTENKIRKEKTKQTANKIRKGGTK